MINPGVISLASLNNMPYAKVPFRFEIEDNIGESIHIHFQNIRLDFTIEEFRKLSDDIIKIFDDICRIKNFSCTEYDPAFLCVASKILPYVDEVRIKEIKLSEIMIDAKDENGKMAMMPLPNSRVVKAIMGETAENDQYAQVNLYRNGAPSRMTNHERIVSNYQLLKEHGYPVNGDLITVKEVNGMNLILDGQHRAAILYAAKGDIKVPVRYFVSYKYKIV